MVEVRICFKKSLILTQLLLSSLFHSTLTTTYDCYDRWCKGTGLHLGEIIPCDQETNFCKVIFGEPHCLPGISGDGISCPCWNFKCYDDPKTTRAACSCADDNGDDAIMMNVMMGLVVTVIVICGIVCVICASRSICTYFNISRDTPGSEDPNSMVITNPDHVNMGFEESLDAPPSYFEVQLVEPSTETTGPAPPSYSDAVRDGNLEHETGST